MPRHRARAVAVGCVVCLTGCGLLASVLTPQPPEIDLAAAAHVRQRGSDDTDRLETDKPRDAATVAADREWALAASLPCVQYWRASSDAADGDGEGEGAAPVDLTTDTGTGSVVEASALAADWGTVTSPSPRLSWQLRFAAEAAGPAAALAAQQSAYRVQAVYAGLLFSAGADLLWDSGVVHSNNTVDVLLGTDAEPLRRVRWRVRVWDASDRQSAWSEPASFEVPFGARGEEEWEAAGAEWLSSEHSWRAPQSDGACGLFAEDGQAATPLFRMPFAAPPRIAAARLVITGLGNYEAEIDGRRVGDSYLDPAWTRYDRTVYYSSHDVTELVAHGSRTSKQRVLGVRLGHGWWNVSPLRMWGTEVLRRVLPSGAPRFIAVLLLRRAGSHRWLVAARTHRSCGWRTTQSETIRSDVFLGELVDGSRAKDLRGWSLPSYDGRLWPRAVPAGAAPKSARGKVGQLLPQPLPPIRRQQQLAPAKVQRVGDAWVVDMSRNFAGQCEFRLRATQGGTGKGRLQVLYGELLGAGGSVNVMTSTAGQVKFCGHSRFEEAQRARSCPDAPCLAAQRDVYLWSGPSSDWKGYEETFAPRWAFRGFRYLSLSGWPEWAGGSDPASAIRDGVRCWAMRSDVAAVGSFESSDERLDRAVLLAQRTFESNLMGVQSDCPHREKFGYGGDQVGVAESVQWLFSMAAFYAKSLRDTCDAQKSNGGLTETSPDIGLAMGGMGGGSGPIGWQAWGPMAAKWHWQWYGGSRALQSSYGCLKSHVEFLGTPGAQQRVERGLGDWLGLEEQALSLTGHGWEKQCYDAFADVSAALGKRAAAAEYRRKGSAKTAEINRKFLLPDGSYHGRSTDFQGNSFSFNGTQCGQAMPLYLGLPSDEMRSRVEAALVRSVEKHCFHGRVGHFGVKWLLMALAEMGRNDVAHAVVTRRGAPGLQNWLEQGATTMWETWGLSDGLTSHNHPMLGSHVHWAFATVAGMQPAASARGFSHVVIAPSPPPSVMWVNASHATVRGTIRVHWQRDGDTLRLRVHVPPGVRAFVSVPATAPEVWQVLPHGRAAVVAGSFDSKLRQVRLPAPGVGAGAHEYESTFSSSSLPSVPTPVPAAVLPDGGITLHEVGRPDSTAFVPFSAFSAGQRQCWMHGPAWDVCGPGAAIRFSSGGRLHTTAGSRVGAWSVSGAASVVSSAACMLTFTYDGHDVSAPRSETDGRLTERSCYWELVS
eukprot:TRINITY_DN18553_c0_g1_i1.p1 TRINITY_DN18553_c0_g1~~TRINITY_DN18553_c0_g1_i1.p1  ORF type:complete len:1216 (+),score=314.11 TRINITY_DN18553_c0_g1_i1:67-3714(+)